MLTEDGKSCAQISAQIHSMYSERRSKRRRKLLLVQTADSRTDATCSQHSPLGASLLGRHSSIDPREREIVIDRVCVRCRCEYEWGVHVAFFWTGAAHSTGSSDDSVWSERERLLVRLVDELHESSTLSESRWGELTMGWSPSQLIELLILVGWYHLISFVTNGARIELEEGAPRFPQEEGTGEG